MADPNNQERRERRLLDAIFHDPRHELTHEHDCAACAVAFEVASALAQCYDINGDWDLPAVDAIDDDTRYEQVERVVAYVLHRRLPGHSPAPGRPIPGYDDV